MLVAQSNTDMITMCRK